MHFEHQEDLESETHKDNRWADILNNPMFGKIDTRWGPMEQNVDHYMLVSPEY